MHFIFDDKIQKNGGVMMRTISGQAMVEYLGAFAVIAGLAIFASNFFTKLHTDSGTGALDAHHRAAMQQIVGGEIPPIYTYYGDGKNSPPGTYPPNYSNTSTPPGGGPTWDD